MDPIEFSLTNNAANIKMFVIFDPWGETLHLAPGSNLRLKIYSEQNCAIETSWTNERVESVFTVTVPDRSYLQVFVDGEDKTPEILAKD